MGLFDKLFGRKKEPTPSTSEVARERLTLMLVHDRLKLTPDLLERIKEELLAVISKYVEIDESGVDVELTHTEHSDKLVARMPVRRQRIHFERDVLEPGMGIPLVAASTLAQIHQPPASAAATAPSAPAQAAAPAPEAPAASVLAGSTSETAATPAPASTAQETQEPSPPAETPAQAVAEAAPPSTPGSGESAQADLAAPAGALSRDFNRQGGGADAAPTAETTAPDAGAAPAAAPTKG